MSGVDVDLYQEKTGDRRADSGWEEPNESNEFLMRVWDGAAVVLLCDSATWATFQYDLLSSSVEKLPARTMRLLQCKINPFGVEEIGM